MTDNDQKLLDELLSVLSLSTSSKDLRLLGRKLKRAIGRPGSYSYKHLHSVARGMKPGAELTRAMLAMLAMTDGASAAIGAYTIQVRSMNPAAAGSLIPPTDPKICDRDNCPIKFIPNVSWRKRCYLCSPIRSN